MSKYLETWERRATVRSLPRLIYECDQRGYFFPRSHQPLLSHPLIMQLSEEDKHFLMTQSFYKYCNDISVIETRVVNNTSTLIASDLLPVTFSDDMRMAALTIVVDEAYHAYAAYDALRQIQSDTKILPLELPKTIEIQKSLNLVKSKLDEKYHTSMDLIAVCLAENTLTKEIIDMSDEEETHPFFQKLVSTHLKDEGRHSGFFFRVLKFYWDSVDDDYKSELSKVIPEFIINYLGVEVQKEYDAQILTYLGFDKNDIDLIFNDIYGGFVVGPEHPMVKNILLLLKRAGVLSYPGLVDTFISSGWNIEDTH